MTTRTEAIRAAGAKLFLMHAPRSQTLTSLDLAASEIRGQNDPQRLVAEVSELAKAAVEEALTGLRDAVQAGDSEQIKLSMRTLEAIAGGRAANVPQPEDLKDAAKRNALLLTYQGMNNCERAINFLMASFPAFERLSWSDQVVTAGKFCNTGELPNEVTL